LDSVPARLVPRLAGDLLQPVAAHLRSASERLRLFVDAQLLISAQTTSRHANALYGASALDMPRRGVMHLEGGIGTIAQILAQAIHRNGGQVLLHHEAGRIVQERGRPVAVEAADGTSVPADLVVANLPPWNVARLLGDNAPPRLRRLPPKPATGWGAFMLYLGVDNSAVPPDLALHHQVVVGEPLGNGNSIFLSNSPAWDGTRAPPNKRAITLSAHTDLSCWWDLYQRDRAGYEALKRTTADRLLSMAETAIPGLREAADLLLPGTPVTYERYTRRAWGWVGGFPQTSLFRFWGPRLGPGLWMVGDSIFPGQSTAAVALGGLRVAKQIGIGTFLEH
jgi:phytoene dehydrogenase-like protein